MSAQVKKNFRNQATPRRKSQIGAGKRKSLRLQHSISLNIPLSELNGTNHALNCFIDFPQQVFSLTYLEVNDTQNPESLTSLEELKKVNWEAYVVGCLYNFSYQLTHLQSLEQTLNSMLKARFESSGVQMTYHSKVTVNENLNPTDNDSPALLISIMGRVEEKEILLYKGYLLSWCNPMKESRLLLPILLCRGKDSYKSLINGVLSERFDAMITKLILSQEDFTHLSTYCLIMLEESDNSVASFSYKIPPGTIKFEVSVESLLKLWNKIHLSGSNEVDLDEIFRFHEAIEGHCESTYGIKLGHAHFDKVVVSGCFSLAINTKMWFKSTKIIHVVLKYLNYLAVQRLKVRALNNNLENTHSTRFGAISL